MSETNTIVAYFEDNATASTAIEALHEAGFTSAHLGVAHNSGSSSSSTSSVHDAAAKVGETTSSVWGKVKNFFEGESAEPYADERTQGDLATREITPNPADSYGTSDLHQNLGGLSVPEEHSRYFSQRLGSSAGGVVVTVNAGARATEAQTILTRYGADLGEGASTYDYSAAPTATTSNIQLLGEVLRVNKERVSRGEVVVRKEVITETQTIEVPVTREELVIERVAASDMTGATGTIGQSGTIRIPLTEEIASIDKSTVVREEFSIGKKAVEEVRAVGGEVRHEELVVEDETIKQPIN